jgi:hypothetical protein
MPYLYCNKYTMIMVLAVLVLSEVVPIVSRGQPRFFLGHCLIKKPLDLRHRSKGLLFIF